MKRILLIPPRITALLAHDHGRVFKIILMILVLITALYTKEYRGAHQVIINSHIGGIFYVLFGSLLFSVVFRRMNFYWPVILAFFLTCLLEVIQYFRFNFMLELTKTKLFEFLFGNSFNPVDFIYYVIGAFLALGVLFLLQIKPESSR